MGHAQTGDRPHPIGVTDRGVPHDRCAPVVADQHDRLIGERGGDRSDVARELLQRVSLDLGRDRAAAVPTHVERGNPIPVRRQELDLVVPRARELRPARHAQHGRAVARDLDSKGDVAVRDLQLFHAAIVPHSARRLVEPRLRLCEVLHVPTRSIGAVRSVMSASTCLLRSAKPPYRSVSPS